MYQVDGEEGPLNAEWAPSIPSNWRLAMCLNRASNTKETTHLFCACLPTFGAKDKTLERLEEAKDRISLFFFCGSASGDKMIKPLLLYKDSNPPLVFQKEINAFLFSCEHTQNHH